MLCLDLETLPCLSPLTASDRPRKGSRLFSSPLLTPPGWDSVSELLSLQSALGSIMPLTACQKNDFCCLAKLEKYISIPPWRWWKIWRRASQPLWISGSSCLMWDLSACWYCSGSDPILWWCCRTVEYLPGNYLRKRKFGAPNWQAYPVKFKKNKSLGIVNKEITYFHSIYGNFDPPFDQVR